MAEHLLLLEDDEVLRHHLGRKLERHQYQVVCCATLDEAKDAITSSAEIHVAVLDQNVGHDNGLDLITPLLEKFPACRILILTGYGSIPAAVAATRRGARNYLTKPASLNDILHAIGDDAETPLPALPDAPPSLERLEWDHIQRVMEEHDGNISAAARTLGIHRRTLQRRLKKRPSASEYERDRS
ncbi:MAG: response regulator [Alcanivoracaceae bacterium]|jgi:two-component system response regulator RegA|nr:response regulator [Alcanivoracaceae bacterium]